ncbi:MAG: NADH-quinone oxidoreductase subunit E [Pseudomonadota bacterium]
MFQNWTFLLAEIWLLLALAALVGLIAGAILFSREKPRTDFEELERLKIELQRAKMAARKGAGEETSFDDLPPVTGGGYVRPSARARAAKLEKSTDKGPDRAPDKARDKSSDKATSNAKTAPPPNSQSAPAAATAAKPQAPSSQVTSPPTPEQDAFSKASKPTAQSKTPAPSEPKIPHFMRAAPPPPMPTRPATLTAPRDGLPDDLTKIKGVGAKLEKLCNDLGIWHYDQIAAWSKGEIAWVDDNLEGFKGRVTRDGWVEQAAALAKNEPPSIFRRRR